MCEFTLLSIPLWTVYLQSLQSIWVCGCFSTRIVVSKKQNFYSCSGSSNGSISSGGSSSTSSSDGSSSDGDNAISSSSSV